MTRGQKIAAFLQENPNPLLTADELAVLLCVPAEEKESLIALLGTLVADGVVIQTKKGRYGSAPRLGYVQGIFRGNERGFGFVLSETAEGEDIFIPAEATRFAMDGDRVLAHITTKARSDKKREGEITRILTHAHNTLVGQFSRGKKFGFVTPDDKRLTGDIFISREDYGGAADGQKVVVTITNWPEGKRGAEGKITEILGNPDDAGVDILCILKNHGLAVDFPPRVKKALGDIPDAVSPESLSGREDFRDTVTITIDGADARDLDDAVSIATHKSGWTLGVHIADVSHYVTEGSALDKEAFRRGTSVYVPDRVVPMLPPKLSNGICSLNPRVDRLTLSCIMKIDKKGCITDHRITPGVICTNERMTYDDVTAILEGDKALRTRYKEVLPTITALGNLAKVLKAKRMADGSIDFNFPEAKITLDADGHPTDVTKYPVGIANGIIEECMLIANQTVAAHFTRLQAPFVYRVHQKPSPDKIAAFQEYLRPFGYGLKHPDAPSPKEFSEILEKIKGTPAEGSLGRVMLRSLMKAKYFEEDLGHFGLAFENYCHFTSPIRRYPDLCIHRIIKELLAAPLSPKRDKKLREFVKKAAVQASETELVAQEAEREADDMKKAEFMAMHLGETFAGTISSVTGFGFFVELDNTCEGLVRLADLADDYYIYNEKSLTLTGQRTGRQYALGDRVQVTVARASAELKQVDFVLAKGE